VGEDDFMSYAKPITQHRLKMGYSRRLLRPPKGWSGSRDPGLALASFIRDDGRLRVEIEAVPLEGPGYQKTPVGYAVNTIDMQTGEYDYDNQMGDFTRLDKAVAAARKWMKEHPAG